MNTVTGNIGLLREIPIAHRGLHSLNNGNYPENSVEAFINAMEHGYIIELDVQLSADNEIVVFHDASAGRMTGLNAKISQLTLSQIKELRLKGGSGAVSIPTLDEVLNAVGGKVPLLIETKTSGKGGMLEDLLCGAIVRYVERCGGDVFVQSFNPFSLGYIKKKRPHIPRGQIAANYKGNTLRKFFAKNFYLNFFSAPQFITCNIARLPDKRISAFRDKGLPILGYTVRDEETLVKTREYCDGIIFEGFLP